MEWSTASEHNTLEFTIERSMDGVKWISIGKAAASGNSFDTKNYRFMDTRPLGGINYYRIRQEDIDSKYTFGVVRAVRMDRRPGFTVLGNPVKNKQLVIRASEAQQIKLVDMSGKVLLNKKISIGLILLICRIRLSEPILLIHQTYLSILFA